MPDKSSVAKNIVKFVFMALWLGISGIVFGIIFAYIGGGILGADSIGFGTLGLAIFGFMMGYIVGIIIGIILIRKLYRQSGSIKFGIAGGIVGAVVTILASVALDPHIYLFFAAFLFIVPVFCLAGFYLKR